MKKKGFTYISAYLLLAVILIGSTGITFSFHSCSSSSKTDITVFPEFFSKEAGCCSDADVHPSIMEKAEQNPVEFQASACCRINKAFFKMIVYGVDETCKFTLVHSGLFMPDGFVFSTFPSDQELTVKKLPLPDPSPPLYGKQLVYFLNQAKIPVPVC